VKQSLIKEVVFIFLKQPLFLYKKAGYKQLKTISYFVEDE